MIQVGIIGATGYAGAELVRLLMNHPKVKIAALSSVSFKGKKISDVYESYKSLNDMVCQDEETVIEKSDVVFAALPHGLSQETAEKCYKKNKVFIDLGADFRLDKEDEYKEWYNGTFLNKDLHKESVYGLPEFFREDIKGKRIIANPGCYTTGAPLALAPAIVSEIISENNIICDSKSGVTGAGRSPSSITHFPEMNEGFHAYAVANHRHTPEIEQTLSKLSGKKVKVTFVPHLIPVNRGILSTCYGKLNKDITIDKIIKEYKKFYKDDSFIRILDNGKTANIKNVKYSNFCDISLHIDNRTNTFIATSAIDNMVKGAAGQAIQNMNIVLNFKEDTGLKIVPPAF